MKVSMSIGGEEVVPDINNMSSRDLAKAKAKVMNIAMETPDIFSWANLADAEKNDMKLSLYVFTKNFTVYNLNHSKPLEPYLRAQFVYDIINAINLGAGTGLSIRDIHNETSEENTLDVAKLSEIQNAQVVIEQMAYSSEQVEDFDPEAHDLKRIAGVALMCEPTNQKPFFIIKQLQQSSIVGGEVSWGLTGNKVSKNPLSAAIKVALDNQMLVFEENIFVFNVSKFSRLFKYDPKKKAVLDSKLAEIEKQFGLSFPDGLDMRSIAEANPQLAEKILRSEPAGITQDQIIEQADKFQLALMTDDAGKIIIMDARDATMFANLLNDDYVESDMTDRHYLATKKKEVFDTEDKQMNLGA